jgi:hypothetical protein
MEILVELNGVLKSEDGKPIITGVLMYAALAAYNRVTIMTDMREADAIRWMNENKVVDFDKIIDSSVYLTDEQPAHRQINLARSRGGVALFVTNNPEHWAYAFEIGIPSEMFGVPSYTRAEFRPDAPRKVRAWNQIEEAVAKQNAIRTQDRRTANIEGFRFE